MMKKRVIIPAVLFTAVFCVSFLCQRYTLIVRENLGLFLFTPDWLREVFSGPMPLSNLLGSFLEQFYAEPVAGPVIPAALLTVIYLCTASFLHKCRVPFNRAIAAVAALAVWCLTANRQWLTAMYTALLISAFLWAVSLFIRNAPGKQRRLPEWIEPVAAIVLIAGASAFEGLRKDTRENEIMARVVVNAGRGNWNEVLAAATPARVQEQPLMMPFAILALNSRAGLAESLFEYPVTGMECMDLRKDNNAFGDFVQSLIYEMMGNTNEAIHQMFQFSTNFNHGMTHLSLRRLIRLNIDAGHYRVAVKYAGILRRNLFYRYQADRIVSKYEDLEDIPDKTGVSCALAPVFTNDPTSDMMLLIKNGAKSPVVMDRFLAYLLVERNLEDFLTIFYNFNWSGSRIPSHYQEALLLTGDIREGISIDPAIGRRYKELGAALSSLNSYAAKALSEGTYWKYYNSKKN